MAKNKSARRASLVTIALTVALVPTVSQAQWLTYTGSHPNLNGSFFGGTGAYAGNVTVQATNINDGLGNGVPGIIQNPFSNLTPTFYSNGYPTNPGPSLDSFGVTYNDTGDSYLVTVDFTGLANGYLPSGTLMAILDMDISENAREFKAFDPSNTQITTPWLNNIPGIQGLFDYNNSAGDLGGAVIAPNQIWTGLDYTFLGDPTNQDSAFLGFNTNANISKMSFFFNKNTGAITAGGGGYGIAFQANPVPEPCTMGILALGAVAGLKRLRGRRK